MNFSLKWIKRARININYKKEKAPSKEEEIKKKKNEELENLDLKFERKANIKQAKYISNFRERFLGEILSDNINPPSSLPPKMKRYAMTKSDKALRAPPKNPDFIQKIKTIDA